MCGRDKRPAQKLSESLHLETGEPSLVHVCCVFVCAKEVGYVQHVYFHAA